MCPAAMAGGQGKEHAPATGARPHTARPVKDRSTYPRSAATHEGRGGTLPPHGPPGTPSCPRWRPDCGPLAARAQQGRALTHEPCGSTLRTDARREESRRGPAAGRAVLYTVAGDVPGWGEAQGGAESRPGHRQEQHSRLPPGVERSAEPLEGVWG